MSATDFSAEFPKKSKSWRIIAVVVIIGVALTGFVTYAIIQNNCGNVCGQSSHLTNVLSVWEERCGTAYISPSSPNAGGICAESLAPVTLPATFNVSSLVQNGEGGTDFTYYFGIVLTSSETVRVSMNSNAYVDFRIYFDNRTGYDTKALANEVQNNGLILFNATDTELYDNEMMPYNGSGLYVFELSVMQPTPIASVTFDIGSLTN